MHVHSPRPPNSRPQQLRVQISTDSYDSEPGAVGAPLESASWRTADRELFATLPRPGRPGRLSALSVFHSKSVLYGVFVWARRVLNRQKWRFPARAVTPEGTLPSISVQDLAGSAGAGDPEGRKSFVGAPTS
jgi:hypothetical protein